MNKILLSLGIMLVLLGSNVFGLSYESNNLTVNYNGGQLIKGFVNLSFDGENPEGIFTSNFEGNLSLIDLLRLNNLEEVFDYNCSTPSCLPDYAVSGDIQGSSVVSGDYGKVVGFQLSGKDVQITSADFNFGSNVLASCNNQFSVDILDDGEGYLVNNKHNSQSCGISYSGCFDGSVSNEVDIVSGKEYCEKINLPSAPAFMLGAKVRNSTSGNSDLTMSLYDFETGFKLSSCKLPKNSQQLEELNCLVNSTSSTSKEYFVCISSQSSVGYKIGWETSSPTCGSAQGFSQLESDFDIFAETVKFSGTPQVYVNDAYYNNQFGYGLTSTFDQYLVNKYSRDCINFNCVIPIRFFGDSQYFQFINLSVGYEISGVPTSIQGFKELIKENSEVDSKTLRIDLSKANFKIPIDSVAKKFELYFEGKLVFEVPINIIKGFDFDVNPKVVPFGSNNLFKIASSNNVTSSTWDFGDGSSLKTANGNSVSHAYIQQNKSNFDLRVSALSGNLSSIKTFKIYVGNPKELANSTIKDYKERVDNVTKELDTYPVWIKDELNKKLDLSAKSVKLNSIEVDYINSVSEEDYQKVMLDLISLKIPSTIVVLSSGDNFPLSVGFDSINPSYLERLSNSESNGNIKSSIIGWMDSNFNSEISFEKIGAVYGSESEVILSKFKISTRPLGTWNKESYLIFGQDLDKSGKFKEDYKFNSLSEVGIDYIQLGENNEDFEFVLFGEYEPETLGSYISPLLNDLPIKETIVAECNLNNICESGENSQTCPEDCSKKVFTFTLIGWMALIVLALVLYILLQEWYKRYYRKSLFPDENELYNLINFIYNGRKSGFSDGDIKDRLDKSGWSHEKIRFALRKIDGKRTGMFEIPLFKFAENKKVINEIQNRQPRPIDRRFIRRRI